MSSSASGSKFAEVADLDQVNQDWAIPSGETYHVRRFQGAASYLDDTVVSLVWDPGGADSLIACTHGDAVFAVDFVCVGDGTKVLRVSLTNDTAIPRLLGATWEAKVVPT